MNYNETSHIKTPADVKVFFHHIVCEKHVSFHPDDDFADYVYFADRTPIFNEQEVMLYNRLMDESFDACEKASADIYSIGYDEMMVELKRMRAC